MKFQQALQFLLEQEKQRHEAIKAKEEICPVPPYHIYVEPTNACFLNCVFCVDKAQKGDKIGYLTSEMWRKIVDALSEYKILSPINIIGRGEPLMHKSLPEFVEYGNHKELNCSIITNGVILKKALGEKLIKAGIKKIQFSLHAHSPETYKKLTGFDYYDRIKKNILDLVEINEKQGKPCFINVMSVENSMNKHESNDFLEYWSEIVDNCFVTPLYSVQGTSKMSEEAMETTFSHHEHTDHPGCVNPWIFMGFRYDGQIIPCPYDFPGKFIIGNIMDEGFDLMKVWNSENIRALRRCQLTKDFSFSRESHYACEKCDVPFAPDSYKGLGEYTDNFPIVFSRMFGPILRNA
tara:strand:+ start:2381 stop:3430 length:1050 start_codon:yes stop_codon:yes gene_type:complete